MDEKEKTFTLSKNLLDMYHAECLAYFETTIVIIATVVIAVDIQLFSVGDIRHIIDATTVGLLVALFAALATTHKTNTIRDQIRALQTTVEQQRL